MHKNQFSLSFDNYILSILLTCYNYKIKILRQSKAQEGYSELLKCFVNVIKIFTVFQLHHRKTYICAFLFTSNFSIFLTHKIIANVLI